MRPVDRRAIGHQQLRFSGKGALLLVRHRLDHNPVGGSRLIDSQECCDVKRADGTTQPLFSNITIFNTQASSGLNLGN
jgi:hypothetical protein